MMKPWAFWGWDATAPHEARGCWQGEGDPVGLPENVTDEPPPPAQPGKIICRENSEWVYVDA